MLKLLSFVFSVNIFSFLGSVCGELATVALLVFATEACPGSIVTRTGLVDTENDGFSKIHPMRGFSYAILLSLIDIGDSISDWFTAPIVSALGIVYGSFSNVCIQ